jgi:hypothetical protein
MLGRTGDRVRRILLVALMGIAVVVMPTSAFAAHGKAKPKPAAFKTGTYNAKVGAQKFAITLKRSECNSAPYQGTSTTHLCVALPVSPPIDCIGAANDESPLGSFVIPVQLPSSGKLTQQTDVTSAAAIPGGPPTMGQSSFSVTFTKKGTASGYIEQNLKLLIGTATIPCMSGKVPFTAKLG